MGTLFIVGTPIGNLDDITIRALETLKEVDIIACEDTRHTVKLLNRYGIKKKLISCRAHNEESVAKEVVSILAAGKNVAYVSDAGTPGMSDPGRRLVAEVRGAGHEILPIPGVSAVTALISVSGFPGATLLFEGFLSVKPGKRRRRLNELLDNRAPFLLYESPHRIMKLLLELHDLEADRTLLVGREMTKKFEEYIEGTPKEVIEELERGKKVKGEFSVLVSGKKKS